MSGSSFMILAVCSFAVTHACVKALTGIPFHQVVFFRAIVSLAICLVMLWRAKVPMLGNNKKVLILRGLAGTLALSLYFYTLQALPLATAVTIQYLSPLLTILISHYWLKEAAKPIQWLFFVIAFCGVMLIGGFDPEASLLKVSIGLLAALGSAFAYNCVRKLKDSEHELVIILYFPMITTPLLTPFVVADFVPPTLWQWIGLLAVGIFTQIAQVFMTRAYQKEPAAKISIYNYLGIVFAILVGAFVFNETLNQSAVLGIGVIFVSVLLSSLVRIKSNTGRSATV
jgi:drug/metabolite transporter (DMT)-like permease